MKIKQFSTEKTDGVIHVFALTECGQLFHRDREGDWECISDDMPIDGGDDANS